MKVVKKLTGKSLVLALVLVVSPFGNKGRVWAQEPAFPTITIDEAIDAALAHSPQMAQAMGSLTNAGANERSALGSYLPSLSFSTGGSRRSSEIFNPTTNTMVRSDASVGYNAGLNSSIDLFTGGRRGAEMERARADLTAADAGLVQQKYSVILNTKRAFFEVLRSGELIRVSKLRLERAEEALEAAERRAKVGSATESDVLRARLEVTNARQALLRAENQKTSGSYELGRLVGAPGAVEADPDGALVVKELDLDREMLVEEVLRQAPAIRSALASADAAEAGAKAARAQYLPTISASAGYNLANQEVSLATSNKSWSLGFSLSYPIFNRFQREANVQRANVQADIASTQLADARRQARAELERVLGALELAQLQIELTEEAVRVAEDDLRLQQERYRLGVSTILDQVTSQANLVQAEVDLINARFDYQTALAELEALLGREI